MEKGRLAGILALAVVTAVTVGVEYPKMAAQQREAAEYRALLEATPLAQVEGETASGQMQVATAGRTDQYVSGWIVPESIQITEVPTGRVLWQMPGQLTQRAAWSPDGRFLALAYSTRTQSGLKIVDTQTWTDWDFTLPDGSPIPEYIFFPEDWARWRGDSSLEVALGRGEGEEAHTYCCSLLTDESGQLTGSVLEETTAILSEDYDFDHDGVPETTELVTVEAPDGDVRPAWYELRITRQDGTELWSTTAHWSHPGWTSVFACQIDGQDYLLQYEPEMWQGWGEYTYRLFHPYIISTASNEPAEQVLRESAVTWDLNFGREGHHLNAAALADFLEEVHGYLDRSTLLLSTEDGEFRTGGSGAAFRLDMDLWDAFCPYDETRSLLENLENLERVRTAARQAAETA